MPKRSLKIEHLPSDKPDELRFSARRPLGGAWLQGSLVIALTALLAIALLYGLWRLVAAFLR